MYMLFAVSYRVKKKKPNLTGVVPEVSCVTGAASGPEAVSIDLGHLQTQRIYLYSFPGFVHTRN